MAFGFGKKKDEPMMTDLEAQQKALEEKRKSLEKKAEYKTPEEQSLGNRILNAVMINRGWRQEVKRQAAEDELDKVSKQESLLKKKQMRNELFEDLIELGGQANAGVEEANQEFQNIVDSISTRNEVEVDQEAVAAAQQEATEASAAATEQLEADLHEILGDEVESYKVDVIDDEPADTYEVDMEGEVGDYTPEAIAEKTVEGLKNAHSINAVMDVIRKYDGITNEAGKYYSVADVQEAIDKAKDNPSLGDGRFIDITRAHGLRERVKAVIDNPESLEVDMGDDEAAPDSLDIDMGEDDEVEAPVLSADEAALAEITAAAEEAFPDVSEEEDALASIAATAEAVFGDDEVASEKSPESSLEKKDHKDDYLLFDRASGLVAVGEVPPTSIKIPGWRAKVDFSDNKSLRSAQDNQVFGDLVIDEWMETRKSIAKEQGIDLADAKVAIGDRAAMMERVKNRFSEAKLKYLNRERPEPQPEVVELDSELLQELPPPVPESAKAIELDSELLQELPPPVPESVQNKPAAEEETEVDLLREPSVSIDQASYEVDDGSDEEEPPKPQTGEKGSTEQAA